MNNLTASLIPNQPEKIYVFFQWIIYMQHKSEYKHKTKQQGINSCL